MINTIELFPDGRIGAYEMPTYYINDATKDVVYFKDQSNMIHTFITKGGVMEVDKPYLVPDGYEVKIENVEEFINTQTESGKHTVKYATLVLKEKVDFSKFEGRSLFTPKQQSIEEAAEQHIKDYDLFFDTKKRDCSHQSSFHRRSKMDGNDGSGIWRL